MSGLDAIKDNWEFYSPNHVKLTEIIDSNDWRVLKEASKMRNDLIHGIQVFEKETCKKKTEELLKTLDNIKRSLDKEYGYSGWKPIKKKEKSTLHTDSQN